MAALSERAREILGKRSFAHVATLMEDGAPHVTPVWVEADGDLILFNTARGLVKERNLSRDPRVAISMTDPDDPYLRLVVRGRMIEMSEEGADEHIDRLSRKYMDVASYPWRDESEMRLIVRVEAETVSVGL